MRNWLANRSSRSSSSKRSSRSEYQREGRVNNSTRSALWSILVAMVSIRSGLAAETLDRLVAGAKKESELTFIAGAQTFGGPKTLAALEAAFNKRFGRQYGRRRAEKFGHTSDAELRKKVSNLIRRTNWWTCFIPINRYALVCKRSSVISRCNREIFPERSLTR